MGLYRLYIDEVGNHDMNHVDDENHRFLSLTGVIIETNYCRTVVNPEMDSVKRKYFQTDPDIPVIFHRKEMVNRRDEFQCLQDPQVEAEFNKDILRFIENWDFKVITVVIDKKAHRDQYQVWHYHPYHYCLAVMLERYILFLHYGKNRGDVMIEARGTKEDEKLKASFQNLYLNGNDNIPAERWQNNLTSREIKVKPKTANICGLQLADLLAHPSRREILIEKGLKENGPNVFGDKICEKLRIDKYLRHYKTGIIEGFGKKLLP
jgi:hypothetical protein